MRHLGYLLMFALLVSAWCLSAGAADSISPESSFYDGNKLYEEGDYSGAIKEYLKVIDSGMESANIYYNLGNAYFRDGQLGMAILNYERAKRLAPRDADCLANYKFARAKITGPVFDQRGIWGWRLLRRYYENFTVNGLLLITSGLYILAVIMLLIAIFRGERAHLLVITASLLFLCMILNIFIVWHKVDVSRSEAVITVPQTETHFGPSDTATVFFKLREGMKVNVLKEKDDWCKVRRADGKTGWLHKEDLERI